MKVNTYSTFEHYAAHLDPIVFALRASGVEVETFTSREDVVWGDRLHPALTVRKPCDYWMVAGSVDYKNVPGQVIYVEHGAGQTYGADERGVSHAISYSNGIIERAALFITPNLFTYHRRRLQQPDVPARLVGMPHLDELHRFSMGRHDGVRPEVVAFAWHWDCQVCPESQSAFPFYQEHLLQIALKLRRAGYIPVTTAHPRIRTRVKYHAERCAFEWWDSHDVLEQAAVLVADNTSLMYEFASLDRPVVVLNAPVYRKDVHHGLRFWEAIPGEQVDELDELHPAIVRALTDDPMADQRATVNALVCPVRDGGAAERAARAILGLRVP